MSDFALQTVITVAQNDTDGNGFNDRVFTTTTSYDENGIRNKEISLNEYFNTAGALVYRSTSTELFDAVGNIISREFEDDKKGDDFIDSSGSSTFDYMYGFNPDGTIASYVEEDDFDRDGVVDERLSYTYDASGNVTSLIVEEFNDDGVLTFSRTTTSTYDTEGELLTQDVTSFSDFDGNGIINSRFTSVLSADGTQVDTFESDFDDDGIVNERTIETYDANGNLVSEVEEFDSVFDSALGVSVDDGIIDSRDTTTYTYDAVGNITRVTFQFDNNADGIVDSTSTSDTVYTYTFFPSGAIASATTQEDFDLNGFIESRETYTYDEAGNILTEVLEEFNNTTGALTSKTSITKTYDEDGNELSSLSEIDSNGDGVLDSRSLVETTILDNVFEGSNSKDRFMGTVGDDIMDGGKGNDVLVGMEGNDELIGGRDRDKMTGGEGEDLFVYTNKKDGGGKGDRIRDFTEDEDMFAIVGRKFKVKGKEGDLLKQKFISYGSEAEKKNQRFVYDADSGLLSCDLNGSGKGKDFVLAKLEKGLESIDIMIM